MSDGFELNSAPSGFRWHGRDAEGLPIITNPDGTVCESLLRFFGWSLKSKRTKISSMKDEAYILRDWATYLLTIKCSDFSVDDEILNLWQDAQIKLTDDDGDPVRSASRVRRKLATVFTYYDQLKEATLGCFDFVSPIGPITCREHPRVKRNDKYDIGQSVDRTWISADEAVSSRKRRKTPDSTGVSAVLSHLRQSSSNLYQRVSVVTRMGFPSLF